MSGVRGSQQDQLIIKRYNPWDKARRNLLMVIIVIVIGVGGYYGGLVDSVDEIQSLCLQSDILQESLNDAEHTISTMSQRLSILEKGGEVDRKSTEGIRQTVR